MESSRRPATNAQLREALLRVSLELHAIATICVGSKLDIQVPELLDREAEAIDALEFAKEIYERGYS